MTTAVGFESAQRHVRAWAERHYGCNETDVEFVPVAKSGLSRGRVYRVTCRSPAMSGEILSFALKDWGWSIDRLERLRSILAFQTFLNQREFLRLQPNASAKTPDNFIVTPNSISSLAKPSIGITNPIPEAIPFFDSGPIFALPESLWTLSSWCRGEPLAIGASLTPELIENATAILAKLHVAGACYGSKVELPPGLWKRISILARAKEIVTAAWRLPNPTILQLKQLKKVQDLSDCSANLQSELSQFMNRPGLCHWIVGDLWRDNILLDGSIVSGIVDFGAARIDWPILELVRWFSSWLAPNDPRLPEIIGAYYRTRAELASENHKKAAFESEPNIDAKQFAGLDRLCTLASLLQWFEWMIGEPDTGLFHQDQPQARINELVGRLECLQC